VGCIQEQLVTITLYGAQSAEGPFIEQITALPPITMDVQTYRDMNWWEVKLEALHKVLNALHADLLGAAVILVIIVNWLRKLFYPLVPKARRAFRRT
jgi:hypothetical protein